MQNFQLLWKRCLTSLSYVYFYRQVSVRAPSIIHKNLSFFANHDCFCGRNFPNIADQVEGMITTKDWKQQ